MVPLVAIVGGMVVVGGMTERASLVASEKKHDGDESSGRPESTSAGRVENLGAVDKFKAGHGGHSLGGGGQGGGCGSGGGQATCFSSALLLSVIWSGAIKKLLWPSSGRQTAPSLPKVEVSGFCPGDPLEVIFFVYSGFDSFPIRHRNFG